MMRDSRKVFEAYLKSNPRERLKDVETQLSEERRKANAGVFGAMGVYRELEAEKAALEKTIAKAEEIKKLREKGLEIWRENRKLSGAERDPSSKSFVSPVKIDSAPDLAGAAIRKYDEDRRSATQALESLGAIQLRAYEEQESAISHRRDMELASLEQDTVQ